MSRLKILAACLVAVLALGACDDGEESSAPATSAASSESPTTVDDAPGGGDEGSRPPRSGPGAREVSDELAEALAGARFVEDVSACPALRGSATDHLCGFVTVPADEDDPLSGETMRIAVARLIGADPDATPVVYLEGGPGGQAINSLPFTIGRLFEPLLADRDVIVVDQRGVGGSQPSLGCEAARAYGDERADEDLDAAEEREVVLEAVRRCGEEIADVGVEVEWFDSKASANDLEAVRNALDVDEWHLFGVSYGTRLGLEVMRLWPDGVASAVLDSVLAPDADLTATAGRGFVASYDAVVELCASQPACADEGDLDERLRAQVARLDDDPVMVEAVNALTGETTEVLADGSVLLQVVFQSLYDPVGFGDLPELADDLEAGSTDALEVYVSTAETNADFVSVGMNLVVSCREQVLVSDPAAVDAARIDDQRLAREFETTNTGALSFEACEQLGVDDPAPGAGEPVESAIPTLLLAGEYDPVTPVSFAEQAAAGLTDARLVVAPLAHAVSTDPCVMQVVRDFLDDPGAEVDPCVDDLQAPELVTSAEVPVGPLTEIDAELPALDLRVRAEVPEAWSDAGSGLDFARGRGLLDPATLSVVGGPDVVLTSITSFLEQTNDEELVDIGDIEVDGRTWQRSELDLGRGWIDVFQRPAGDGGPALIVVLGSGEAERDRLVQEVAVPAMASLVVEPL